MNISPDISELAKALHKAQGTLAGAKKDATNPHFKSRYADLASVWEAARPALQANGLSVTQTFSGDTGEAVTIETMLLHNSGQWMASYLTLKPTKADPQGIGSAITYGRRYGLSSILGIVADDDDDGNQASHQPAKTPARPPETPVWSLPNPPAGWFDWTNEQRGVYMANKGSAALKDWFTNLPAPEQAKLAKLKDEWKQTAILADKTTTQTK